MKILKDKPYDSDKIFGSLHSKFQKNKLCPDLNYFTRENAIEMIALAYYCGYSRGKKGKPLLINDIKKEQRE